MNIKARPVVALGLFGLLAQAADSRFAATEEPGAIERTRAIAADYLKRMPDFICTQTIRRFMRYTMPKTWQPLDTLMIKLRYAGQEEEREVVKRNGENTQGFEADFGGMRNIGEFGGMLEALFDAKTQAVFHWQVFITVAGHPAAVYSYAVDKANSQYELNFDPGYGHHLVVGYRGVIALDRETGGVLQMSYEAEGIPPDFPMQYAKTAIDYDFVDIGGKRYLLPMKSQVETGSPLLAARNISEFSGYRKFSADAAITFADVVEK